MVYWQASALLLTDIVALSPLLASAPVTLTLAELLNVNNTRAITASHFQFVVLPTGAKVNPTYLKKYQGLKGNPKLTPIQVYNLEANAQLIALENARAPQQKKVKEEDNDAELFGL